MSTQLAQKLSIEERRVLVAEGLRSGRTYRALAADFGVSYGAITEDIRKIRKTWAREKFGSYEEAIAEKRQMLLGIVNANSAAAFQGDVPAGALVVKTVEVLARLEGLPDWAAETARLRARDELNAGPADLRPIGLTIQIIPAGNNQLVEQAEEEDNDDDS